MFIIIIIITNFVLLLSHIGSIYRVYITGNSVRSVRSKYIINPRSTLNRTKIVFNLFISRLNHSYWEWNGSQYLQMISL